MISNTDITVREPEAEASELVAEAQALGARTETRRSSIGGRIARAALVLMAGTILSRVLGLGRESSIAFLFGAQAEVDAFTIANHVATIVYDLLIAGTVSAALVPVFSEYAADKEQRPELGRVVSTILTIAAIFLALSVAALEVFAQPLVGFMSLGYGPETQRLALELTQWVLPAVFFMGISGVVMAAHYALGRFVYPAFTSALFNAAIIFCAFTLAGALGVKSLVLGMVVGGLAMVALQAPGLRDVPLRPMLDMSHPAVRKILRLYAPVGLSVAVTSVLLVIDRSLASQTGVGSISAMRYATTLIQFALGLVSAAISLASLPALSRHFTRGDREAFGRTLAAGLRLVTVLVLPVAALLLALGTPLVEVLFEHGAYTPEDRQRTVLALLFYVPGLPFSAIDQVLLFAFYARKNTLTPALVGIAQVPVYLGVALGTIEALGMAGLVLAWSVQLAFHAVVMGYLLVRAMREEGGLRGYGIVETTIKVAGAAAALALVSYGVWWALAQVVRPDTFFGEAILLGVPALTGGGLYAGLVWMMRLPELELILGKMRGRLRR